MKQLVDAFRHRHVDLSPRSVREFNKRFNHFPHNSVTSLLRKAGPFKADRDAYAFTNSGWPITQEDARVLRERYLGFLDAVLRLGVDAVRLALDQLSFSIPLLDKLGLPLPSTKVGLPTEAKDFVIDEVVDPMRSHLLNTIDSIIGSIPGRPGRCGGMAFSALDFFLAGWPVDPSTEKPGSGKLRQYIWNRLLDSLEKNAMTFLEWVMVLHVLPVISRIASGALGVAAGSVAGPLGAAIGAYVAADEDIFGLGGPDQLLGKTREHLMRLRERLDHEAAWPIGFVYSGSANPADQHQVLAIGYEDIGANKLRIKIWDNNDGRHCQNMDLDFQGVELLVNSTNPKLNKIKGIICEEYSFKMPPASLRLR